MQGIADIFLSFFLFSGTCLSAISPLAFLSPADGEQRSCRADCRRKPSLHAALGGFPLSHRMRKRIGGVRRTLSARLFPKNMTDNVLQENRPPLSGRCKTKESRKPAKVSGFPYRIRRLFAQLGNRFLCGGHVVAGGHLLRASIACGFISLALYAAPRMK